MSGEDPFWGNLFTSGLAEDLDHLITAEERLRVAMLRQEEPEERYKWCCVAQAPHGTAHLKR
jgi:hypothetical protein